MLEQKRKNEGIILISKRVGETMGELVLRARAEYGLGSDEKITYAGRLDPLARGLVILLHGKARFDKDTYLKLPKRYEFDLLLGVSTDTGDVLGKVLRIDKEHREHAQSDLDEACSNLVGEHLQTYPAYSSRRIEGKPLFEHTRAGNKVVVPTKKIQITELTSKKLRTVDRDDFVKHVLETVPKVRGDFRQGEIIDTWKEHAKLLTGALFTSKIEVACSSGTYMRVLAEKIASELGTFGLAMNIHRTEIGSFTEG